MVKFKAGLQVEGRAEGSGREGWTVRLIGTFQIQNQNHISKIIPACPALVLFSLFSSNTVWIKGRNEAGATVRVCVSIDLMGNFRSAKLRMMEGRRVGRKMNRRIHHLPSSRKSSGQLDRRDHEESCA